MNLRHIDKSEINIKKISLRDSRSPDNTELGHFTFLFSRGRQRNVPRICPLHDPVTWYKISYTGEQVAKWDFQNKGRCIVLEVPLWNLLISICNFVPCDRVVQRAYYNALVRLLFCSLSLLFSDVTVAVAVVVFLSSLI